MNPLGLTCGGSSTSLAPPHLPAIPPQVIDTEGNYNNVLEVHARPPSVTSKERLQLARWQAANVALETKMMAKLH